MWGHSEKLEGLHSMKVVVGEMDSGLECQRVWNCMVGVYPELMEFSPFLDD